MMSSVVRRLSRQEIDAVTSQRESHEQKVTELENQISKLSGDLREAKIHVDKRDSQHRKVVEDLKSARKEKEEIQEELQKIQQENANKIEQLGVDHQMQVSGLEEKIASLQQEKYAAEEKRRNSTRALKKEKELREAAESSLDDERKKSARMNGLVERTQSARRVDAQAASESQAIISKLQDELKSARSEIELTRSQSLANVEGKSEEIQQYEQTIANLQEELEIMKESLAEVTTMNATLIEEKEEMQKAYESTIENMTASHEADRANWEELKQNLEESIANASVEEKTTTHDDDACSSSTSDETSAKETLELVKIALEKRHISLEFLLGGTSVSKQASSSSLPSVKGATNSKDKSPMRASNRNSPDRGRPRGRGDDNDADSSSKSEKPTKDSGSKSSKLVPIAGVTKAGPNKSMEGGGESMPTIKRYHSPEKPRRASGISVPSSKSNDNTSAPVSQTESSVPRVPVTSKINTGARTVPKAPSSSNISSAATTTAKPSSATSSGSEQLPGSLRNPQVLEQKRMERQQSQTTIQQKKLLEQQKMHDTMRKSRNSVGNKARTGNALDAILAGEKEKPSKLQIGVGMFDLAPQNDLQKSSEIMDGDVESLLYP